MEVVPGLEWDDVELDVYEDPNPVKDVVGQTLVDNKEIGKSEVPRVLKSHNSKSMGDQKEKWMVSTFRGGFFWLDFTDIHAIYRWEKMDVNFVGAWCLLQYMDAEKTKQSIEYLDPTRICQTQHTVTLSLNSKVNGRYRVNPEDLPRIEHRTNFDDTSITNVQRDLYLFIHRRRYHIKRRFFDLDSILATSNEYKALQEWSNAMP
uniref:Uncharacterized protein n=1 Tax=Oryza sativa subsp. japonica TaxID=39947 RepID=Q2QPR2_ORYSJ|nr:hypothetical protein LOC_Os12g33590 [Oryza sativa Japonica Group]